MNPFIWAKRNITDLFVCGSHTGPKFMRWWHSFSGVSDVSGEQRTFFVEYFIRRASHVTVKAGVFPTQENPGRQFVVTYPISELKLVREPLVLQVADCFHSESQIWGQVGAMEWKLDLHKATTCRGGFWSGFLATALHLFDGFWQGEGICTFYQGSVTLDGQVFQVVPETCGGYSDKHWGRHSNIPLMQLNACKLTSSRTGNELKHSALAIHDFQPRLFIFPLKKRLMIHITYMGEDFKFGLLNPNPLFCCKCQTKETNKRHIWHIFAQNKAAVAKISYSSRKDEMLNLNRKSPLWSGANGTGNIELYRMTSEGRQLLDTLTFQTGFWVWREEPIA